MIQRHRCDTLSFEENYRLAYYIVVSKQGELLYNGVLSLITENFGRLVDEYIGPTLTAVNGDLAMKIREHEEFLSALMKVWKDHITSTQKLSHVLGFMVRLTWTLLLSIDRLIAQATG